MARSFAVIFLAALVAAVLAAGTGAAQDATPVGRLPVSSRPVSLRIDALGVDAPVEPIGTPDDPTATRRPGGVGWYDGLASLEGFENAAMIGAGAAEGGPAVFAKLGDLTPGDGIVVGSDDGWTHRYRVEWVRAFGAVRSAAGPAVVGHVGVRGLTLIADGGADGGSVVVSARFLFATGPLVGAATPAP